MNIDLQYLISRGERGERDGFGRFLTMKIKASSAGGSGEKKYLCVDFLLRKGPK